MKKRFAFILVFIFFIIVLIRIFWLEPYYIPSGSMIPTLLKGDYIWINKLAYGFRNPVTDHLTPSRLPKRGDVIVFKFPDDRDFEFIKRVVGLPGDLVAIQDSILKINHNPVTLLPVQVERALKQDNCRALLNSKSDSVVPEILKPLPYARDFRSFDYFIEAYESDRAHWIQIKQTKEFEEEDFQVLVPKDHVFVLGDNRDLSQDSRFFGSVKISDITGKAMSIWLSLNKERLHCNAGWFGTSRAVRWYRWGKKITPE